MPVPVPKKTVKTVKTVSESTVFTQPTKPRIAPSIQHLAVPIGSVFQDPANARKHPPKNVQAIKDSLSAWGQTKPIVVRRDKMIIVAGNGTHRCATEMGWTEIAASVVDMNDAEAAAYGIADNRTAELAQWDEAVLKDLTQVIEAANQPMVGYTEDHLQVLRAESFVAPKVKPGSRSGLTEDDLLIVKLVVTDDQKRIIEIVTDMIRHRVGNRRLSESTAVITALEEWLPKPSYEREEPDEQT